VDNSSGTNHQLEKRIRTMSNTTSIRRAASMVGATGLIALSMAGPASARPDPGTDSSQEQHCSTSCYEGGTSGGLPSIPIPINDNGIQFLQVGGGLLAGIAVAGAGMALASRRTHAHAAHPV
jgi:hypothetical protein